MGESIIVSNSTSLFKNYNLVVVVGPVDLWKTPLKPAMKVRIGSAIKTATAVKRIGYSVEEFLGSEIHRHFKAHGVYKCDKPHRP